MRKNRHARRQCAAFADVQWTGEVKAAARAYVYVVSQKEVFESRLEVEQLDFVYSRVTPYICPRRAEQLRA